MAFSDERAAAAIYLLFDEEDDARRKERWWVGPICENREKEVSPTTNLYSVSVCHVTVSLYVLCIVYRLS